MTKEDAQLIAQFMQRVDLKGAEVQAFLKAVAALKEVIEKEEE